MSKLPLTGFGNQCESMHPPHQPISVQEIRLSPTRMPPAIQEPNEIVNPQKQRSLAVFLHLCNVECAAAFCYPFVTCSWESCPYGLH